MPERCLNYFCQFGQKKNGPDYCLRLTHIANAINRDDANSIIPNAEMAHCRIPVSKLQAAIDQRFPPPQNPPA